MITDTIGMTPLELKIYENRLRRMAKRQGYELRKSRRQDPYAPDYGKWWIVDATRSASSRTGWAVAGLVAGRPGWDLEDVEAWLTGGDPS